MHTAMANFLLLAVSTFAIVQLFPAMTLAQPRIPSAFSAQVTLYREGFQISAGFYVNYDIDKVLIVNNLGIMSSAAGQSYTYLSDDTVYRYMEAFDTCTATYVGFPVFPQLNMLGNATFQRSHSFMGRQVDVWQYEIIDPYNTDTVEIAFMTSDYDTPAYLLAYGYPIIVDSFTNSPPSYSRLDIPIECLVAKKALKVKGEKGKNKAHFKRRDIFSKIF